MDELWNRVKELAAVAEDEHQGQCIDLIKELIETDGEKLSDHDLMGMIYEIASQWHHRNYWRVPSAGKKCEVCGADSDETPLHEYEGIIYCDSDLFRAIKEGWHGDQGECDKCGTQYGLASRDGRCGDCGNCSDCCTHT